MNLSIQDAHLSYELVPRTHLDSRERRRMYRLMCANYDEVQPARFQADLDAKSWVGVVRDHAGEIQGFTTFAIDPAGSGTEAYHIVFSGDTIIDPAHWGTQVLAKGWSYSVGTFIATDPHRRWYWYLLSKGHRTFFYLPLFFKSYYPSPEPGPDEAVLASIADRVSRLVYGDSWQPTEGVVRFAYRAGQLNEDLAQATYAKARHALVAFFLEKNPGFFRGDELVCLAELHPDNMLRTGHTFLKLGLQSSLPAL